MVASLMTLAKVFHDAHPIGGRATAIWFVVTAARAKWVVAPTRQALTTSIGVAICIEQRMASSGRRQHARAVHRRAAEYAATHAMSTCLQTPECDGATTSACGGRSAVAGGG